jgi:hypothetical protein
VKIIIRLIVSIVLVFCPTAGLTQTPSAPIKVSELKSKPFNVDGLAITVKKFQIPRLVIGSLDGIRGSIDLRLENVGADFVIFRPSRFAVVDKDNNQAFLSHQTECMRQVAGVFSPPPTENKIMIVPGANVELNYCISRGVRYPARLFYGKKLLGEITN